MTTTDRDLLERAAKAAGIQGRWAEKSSMSTRAKNPSDKIVGFFISGVRGGYGKRWDPLHDDSDAFRLAVTRRFTVAIRPHEVEVFCEASFECLASVHTNGVSHEEATRRAIVIAAAMAGEGE